MPGRISRTRRTRRTQESLNMCLGIPGKVIKTFREHDVLMGKVDFSGVIKQVCLEHVTDVQGATHRRRGRARSDRAGQRGTAFFCSQSASQA